MIVVASTLASYKMQDIGFWASWLWNAKAIHDSHPDGVKFMVALELDARGVDPFFPLLDKLEPFDGDVWTFSLDDGSPTITGRNRLVRICTGRNLISQYGQDVGASHILFADADTRLPADVLPKLLEVDYPIVGGNVPTYCLGLNAPLLDGYPFPVKEHMNTAGCLLVARDLFRRLRWRWDLDAGITDDPCYHQDATALGFPTRVRHDLKLMHWPPSIGPVQTRGHDLAIRR